MFKFVTWKLKAVRIQDVCIANKLHIFKVFFFSVGYDMNSLVFDWNEDNAIQLPETLQLPQFMIRGYRVKECTKAYNDGSYLPACFRSTRGDLWWGKFSTDVFPIVLYSVIYMSWGGLYSSAANGVLRHSDVRTFIIDRYFIMGRLLDQHGCRPSSNGARNHDGTDDDDTEFGS